MVLFMAGVIKNFRIDLAGSEGILRRTVVANPRVNAQFLKQIM